MGIKPTIPTIGCDPEVFLQNTVTGEFVPSCGLIGGTKSNPIVIDTKTGIAVLEDNVTLEINIPASANIKEFHERMWNGVRAVNRFVTNLNLQVSVRPQAEFKAEQLKHPQAITFGCDPDFDAFKQGEERMPPSPAQLKNWRCAGHHAHFGFDRRKHKMPPWAIVQYLEAFVTVFDGSATQNNGIRRKFYGLPGLFRPKDYGFEWRSPANWLWGYFTGNYKGNTVAQANIIVTGLLANEKRAFAVHRLIDWACVKGLLSQVETGGNANRFSQLRNDLEDFRAEFMELGQSILAESAEEEPFYIVPIAEVMAGIRHRRQQNDPFVGGRPERVALVDEGPILQFDDIPQPIQQAQG